MTDQEWPKEVVEKYREFIKRPQNLGQRSCDVRFCVLHTKHNTDYQLLFFHGFLCSDLPSNTVHPIDSCDLGNGRSAKLFQVTYSLSEIDNMLSSLNQKTLMLPQAAHGHNQILHYIDLSDIKPVTYIAPDVREEEGTLNFLPDRGSGLHVFELFDTAAKSLSRLNADEIDKVEQMLSNYVDFSITNHKSRVGNILLAANLEPVQISFKGDKSGNGIRVKLTPVISSFDTNDFILTATSNLMSETTGSCVVFPVQRSMYLPGIHCWSKIDVRLWQISQSSLVARNYGRLLGPNVYTQASTRKHLREAIIRDKQGKIIKQTPIEYTVPLNGKIKRLPHWTDKVQQEIQAAKKKALIRQKKLIHLKTGSRNKAIKSLIDVINSLADEGPLKIWDPYIGPYYLDFLTFMESTRDVMVISELKSPLNNENELKGWRRVFRALECGILEDWSTQLPNYLVKFIQEKNRARKSSIKKDRKDNLKSYLNELRSRNINLDLRYKEGEKGFSFHDRFLIGDGRCWSLGSSLNHLGDKHCLVIEVEYPDIIEHEFDKLWADLQGNEL